MNPKKLAVALGGGIAALSLIGAGVGASFTDKATASQTITRGSINLLVSSDNNNDYAKSATFSDPGPITSAAQTISKTLYVYNAGDLTEHVTGLVCTTTDSSVTVDFNGSPVTCTGNSTVGITVLPGQVIPIPVSYNLPEATANFGGSTPDVPTDTQTVITLALHGTD